MGLNSFGGFKKKEMVQEGEGEEGLKEFKTVEVTRDATVAIAAFAAVLGSMQPAPASAQTIDQRPVQSVQFDKKAAQKFISDIQFIIRSPQTKAVVEQAGKEIAEIGVAAAAEVAKPALESAIDALIKIRQGLDGTPPAVPGDQQVYSGKPQQ